MCEMLDEVERRGMERGLEQGQKRLEQVNRLTAFLIKDGRTEELFQATQDSELQEKLMVEYGI